MAPYYLLDSQTEKPQGKPPFWSRNVVFRRQWRADFFGASFRMAPHIFGATAALGDGNIVKPDGALPSPLIPRDTFLQEIKHACLRCGHRCDRLAG